MSRAGNPYDNAKAERFMRTLKEEEVNGKTYASIDEARTDIGAFLENVYNRGRLHSALGYKPPVEFEAELRQTRNRLKGHNQSSVTQIQCLSRGVQFSAVILLLLLRAPIEAPRCKRDDARNGFRALFVIGHHATADAERMRRRVERVGPAFAPALESVRRHRDPRLFLREPPQRIGGHVNFVRPDDIGSIFADTHLPEQFRRPAQRLIDAERLDQTGHVDLAFVAFVPTDAQGQRLLVRFHGDDARQNFLRHG